MSSRHNNMCCNNNPVGGFLGGAFSNNILNLIIFVLIVLQFGKDNEHGDCDDNKESEIDNSILFIIALFFLFVCSCGSNERC